MHLHRCSNSRYVDYICIIWYRYIPFSCSTVALISGSCVRRTGEILPLLFLYWFKTQRETPENCMILFFWLNSDFFLNFFAFWWNHAFCPFLINPLVFSQVYFYLCHWLLAFKGTIHFILRDFSWVLYCFFLYVGKTVICFPILIN